MYRSILVPLDGTAFGEQALPLAREVARRTGGTVHLVHVHAPGGAWTPVEGTTDGDRVTRVEDRGYLESVLATIAGDGAVSADLRVLDGPIGRSVAEWAERARVDLVVMSTHGRAGLSRLWHHDVAGYLSRTLDAPLLTVPVHPAEPAGEARAPRMEQVVVPLAAGAHSPRVLEEVAEFCRAVGARATLLRVIEPPVEVGYSLLGQGGHVNEFLLEDLDEAAQRDLENAARRLGERGVPAGVAVTHGGNPAEAILAYAHSGAGGGSDVIAMETHGMGTVRHLFSSSVVEEVVHGSHVPVMLHRAEAASTERADRDEVGAGMGWTRPATEVRGPASPPLA